LGVAAQFADLYAQHYEPPKEFYYIDALTLIGAILSGRVRADIGLPSQPRLYVCKVARSAWDRKSTSTRHAEAFVRSALNGIGGLAEVLRGVGSAEGLASAIMENKRVVLSFDELRRFEAKAGIQGSALLPMVNELFESNHYQNRTKEHDLKIEDGHLVFISNSTEQTWQELHNASEFKDIGFLNRMLLVTGNTDKRIPRPVEPSPAQLNPLVSDLAAKFRALPQLNVDGSVSQEILLPFTSSAQSTWDSWYCGLKLTPETARLDTIGLRLLSLLAFVSGKSAIDDDVVRATLALLDYQRQVREACAPIVGDNPSARVEEKVRRALAKYGPLTERDLRRHTNGDRIGIEIFGRAVRQLEGANEIRREGGKWELQP
jgi:hypothetical protein